MAVKTRYIVTTNMEGGVWLHEGYFTNVKEARKKFRDLTKAGEHVRLIKETHDTLAESTPSKKEIVKAALSRA